MRTGTLLTGLLLVGACGTQTGAGPGDSPGGAPATATGGIAGFPVCADVPRIRADESLYRDEPVYGNVDELVQEVHEWAAGQPGFVELGLDRERNGWVTVWVKDADVEAMSEQAAERWPARGSWSWRCLGPSVSCSRSPPRSMRPWTRPACAPAGPR
ncbi:MAG: hypothetical protein M3424_01555 [Actinomycetota bacterium]|nr:hypothetical protein [Actinomycetota bacterium]